MVIDRSNKNQTDRRRPSGRNGLWHAAMLAWFAVALLCQAFTTAARCEVPKNLKFPPIEFKTPRVDTLLLANGLRGYLVEDHEIPLVDVVIMFRTGFPSEDKTGLNEIAGWAIRNGGSARFSKEVLDEELEFVGATIESNSGPYVGQITASFLTKDTDRVLEMLADLVVNPAFDEAKIDLRKKTTIEGIRRRQDQPDDLGRHELSRLIFRNHPFGREASAASIGSITREDVAGFHAEYVRPNNSVIGISGDITRDQALERMNVVLAAWKPGGEAPAIPEMKYENVPSVNYIYKDISQAYIFVGHMGINSGNPDKPLTDLANFILGSGSFTSWITKRVRSDEGLAYHAASRFNSSPFGYGSFYATCETRNDAAMRALDLVVEQIERMNKEGPSAEEVADAKDSYVNQQVFEYESSSAVVNRMVWNDLVGLPLDRLERDFEAYQAATVEDIRRVGSQYFHPQGLTILVVGNQDLFDRPLSDFGEVNTVELKEEGETE